MVRLEEQQAHLAPGSGSRRRSSGLHATEADCAGADTASNAPVLALRLYGTSDAGLPKGYVNDENYRVEGCGADNDPGADPNRCDRVFGS